MAAAQLQECVRGGASRARQDTCDRTTDLHAPSCVESPSCNEAKEGHNAMTDSRLLVPQKPTTGQRQAENLMSPLSPPDFHGNLLPSSAHCVQWSS